ncbi:MAG: hypothetical protein WCT14_07360, partial [Treponemataceae bacterium]
MKQGLKRDKSAWMLEALLIALIIVIGFSSCDSAFGFNLQGYAVLDQDLELSWKHTASYAFMDDPLGYWKSPL